MSNLAHLSESYLPRVVDEQVERYLSLFGAVEISGTKWCGKTWTALMHGKSASFVDDDYSVALADPGLMTLGEQPHVKTNGSWFPAYGMSCAARSMRSALSRRMDIDGILDAALPQGRRGASAQRRWPHRENTHAPPFPCGIGRFRRHRFPQGLFEGVFAPGMMAPDSKDALPLVERRLQRRVGRRPSIWMSRARKP